MQKLTINELFSVKDKVAVITGGSRGIGYMIAQAFVENGAKVYISSRKEAACLAAAQQLSELGDCVAVSADLSTQEGRVALLQAVSAREDHVDVLVNNAGATWGAPFEGHPEKGYDKVMDINVKSIFYLTQAFLPMLTAKASLSHPSRVINVGSIDGIKVSAMDNIPYGASKAAVHHLTKILAVKFSGKGITVNAIAPGPYESKMTEWMLDNFQDAIIKTCPMGRIGEPQDMGGIALFLSSTAGAYVNGVVVPVDGGIHIK